MVLKKTLFATCGIILTACILSDTIYANQNPQGLSTDSRIKIISYNPNDVITVHANHFIATNITLNRREQIISIDTGDKLAWDISVNKKIPYRFTIKPLLPNSNTNLIVTTNQRTYLFHLLAAPNAKASNAIYALRFKYPDEQQAELNAELAEFETIFPGSKEHEPIPLNLNYTFAGSHYIAPIQAGDNDTFTVFKFAKNHPIPAIFGVDKHGNETLLNYRTQGDKVFIQGVRRQYTLRNGEDVTTIYNDNIKS